MMDRLRAAFEMRRQDNERFVGRVVIVVSCVLWLVGFGVMAWVSL
jgi:hypothetical protein